ncbi:MAG: hypothetical protein KDD64_14610 [Bdellovibrionales bacterium]|nr:hypothetical protein [Bdellovibrionales bacterium]
MWFDKLYLLCFFVVVIFGTAGCSSGASVVNSNGITFRGFRTPCRGAVLFKDAQGDRVTEISLPKSTSSLEVGVISEPFVPDDLAYSRHFYCQLVSRRKLTFQLEPGFYWVQQDNLNGQEPRVLLLKRRESNSPEGLPVDLQEVILSSRRECRYLKQCDGEIR